MTVEQRMMIEPDDIVAAEIECTKCHHRVVKLPANWQNALVSCPTAVTDGRQTTTR